MFYRINKTPAIEWQLNVSFTTQLFLNTLPLHGYQFVLHLSSPPKESIPACPNEGSLVLILTEDKKEGKMILDRNSIDVITFHCSDLATVTAHVRGPVLYVSVCSHVRVPVCVFFCVCFSLQGCDWANATITTLLSFCLIHTLISSVRHHLPGLSYFVPVCIIGCRYISLIKAYRRMVGVCISLL